MGIEIIMNSKQHEHEQFKHLNQFACESSHVSFSCMRCTFATLPIAKLIYGGNMYDHRFSESVCRKKHLIV